MNARPDKHIQVSAAFCTEIIREWEKSLSVTKDQLLKIATVLVNESGTGYVPDWLRATRKALGENCNFVKGVYFAVSYSGCSAEHLSREFKKYYSGTLIEYITKLRLSYAKKLLTKTNMNITEIALDCGYYSVSHFNHIFLKHFSMPQREYCTKFTVSI